MNIAFSRGGVRRGARLMTVFAVALAIYAPTSRAAEQTLRFAHIHSPEHSTQKAAEIISDGFKKRAGGRVEIRILPNAQLGTERQILEGLMIGTIDMGAIAGNILQGFEASAGLTSLPYLIR